MGKPAELSNNPLEDAEASVRMLMVRNLELCEAVQDLALAVRNHRLNSRVYTRVDLRLWEAVDDLIIYNEQP